MGAGGGGPLRQSKTGVPPGTEVSGHARSSTSGGTAAPVAFLSRPNVTAGAAGGAFGSTGAAGAAAALARKTHSSPGTKIRRGGRAGAGGAGQSSGGRKAWVASMKYFQICTG